MEFGEHAAEADQRTPTEGDATMAKPKHPGNPPPFGIPPARPAPPNEQVQAIESTGVRSIPQPTIGDVLGVLDDMSRKLQQLGKNQRVIDSKLDYLTQRVAAVDQNLIMAASYLKSWSWYTIGCVIEPEDTGKGSVWWPQGTPHWK
jgi:hypothetical protein